MTPATATTTAKAVRKHGGGLVHAALPRAALRGRQQSTSGGVKKSLCCAAAGINALDLQATAARAYPTTGVRQAQKLSTPLRSPIRPPAQLVVGYTHQLDALKRHFDIILFRNWRWRRWVTFEKTYVASGGVLQSMQPRGKPLNTVMEPIHLNFRVTTKVVQPIKQSGTQLYANLQAHTIQLSQLRLINPRQQIEEHTSAHLIIDVVIRENSLSIKAAYEFSCLHAQRKQLLRARNFEISLSPISNILLVSTLVQRNNYRDTDGENRPHSLNPTRCVSRKISMTQPVRNTANHQPKTGTQKKQPPQRPECSLDHLLGELHITLLEVSTARSLPVTRTRVQRGAP